jgi:pimeloyl-ACP methyl ester carboxylesterase
LKLTSLVKYLLNWVQSKDEDFTLDFQTDLSLDESKLIDIYFVHGIADKSHTFNHLISMLKINGLPKNIKSINSVSLTGIKSNIKSFANILLTKIKRNNHKNVVLIGHSRGGIISAYAAEHNDDGINICGVVAIASPFSGSKYALFPLTAIFESIYEMKKESIFLTTLKSKFPICSFLRAMIF